MMDPGEAPEPAPSGNAPATVKRSKVKTGAGLWPLGAALRSFFDISLDFYPRLGEEMRSVPADELVVRFTHNENGVMVPWSTLDPTGLDDAIDLAKASLDEAKAQTEYQDQKATRLLTVTTFLTALAGAFFATFAGDFPLRMLPQLSPGAYWLLGATYVAFLLFVLFALGGALVTFHATRTRFKYPAEAKVANQAGPTRSYLFFREIIGVTPEGWANSFVTVETKDGKSTATLRADLKIEYLKNYVSEAYLIAAKTADTLRYLQPAQGLLAYALRCLVVYIVLLTIVLTTLTPTKPSSAPTEVKILTTPQPVHVQVEPARPLYPMPTQPSGKKP